MARQQRAALTASIGRRRSVAALAAGGASLVIGAAAAQTAPTATKGGAAAPRSIRIGAPATTHRGRQSGQGIIAVARHHGWFEQAFAGEGIEFEFPGFKGGAPIVGQALANNQIDFAWQGDMLSLVGRSAGMGTRLLLPLTRFSNAYLAVPVASEIRSVADLKGKRVSYNKGNQVHLQALRILGSHGLRERDIRSIYLDAASSMTALTAGEVDAVFGGPDILALRERGVARIVYDTRGDVTQTSANGLIARDDFVERHPAITDRFINVLVRAARWTADPANRDEVFKIWAEGSLPIRFVIEEVGDRLADRISPLIDPFWHAHYQQTQALLIELGLLRGAPVDLQRWFDPRPVGRALNELGLAGYWRELDAKGRPRGPA